VYFLARLSEENLAVRALRACKNLLASVIRALCAADTAARRCDCAFDGIIERC
jgi:hypothetical protein